ncbi:unnamed protein product [Spirodela intermedia]|uniref:Uncharacterized protein n=2 Tax=Spirodela intermedia TaxID=51605 RepID=A0A7I8K4N1_SPIIN|nr:unnamed protein product [Spirodela intermedia]CAA6656492.1 unnamed protein product [Spirodela intermedia]CAA7392081.1 unnamed protein product [Spirodela intermedia]
MHSKHNLIFRLSLCVCHHQNIMYLHYLYMMS